MFSPSKSSSKVNVMMWNRLYSYTSILFSRMVSSSLSYEMFSTVVPKGNTCSGRLTTALAPGSRVPL